MAGAQTSTLLSLALNDGQPASARPPFGRLLVASLTLHVGVLVLAGNAQLSDSGERPLVAHEIALVSLLSEPRISVRHGSTAEQPVRPFEASTRKPEPRPFRAVPLAPAPAPVAVQPTPPPAPARQAPPTIAKVEAPPDAIQEARVRSEALMQEALKKIKLPSRAALDAGQALDSDAVRRRFPVRADAPKPVRTPPTPDPTAKTETRSQDLVQEALGKIELPPQAPEFQRLAPAPVRVPPSPLPTPPWRSSEAPPFQSARRPGPSPELQQDIQAVLKKLGMPEAPRPVPVRPQKSHPIAPKRGPRASLTENLKKELQILERLHQPEPVTRSAAAPSHTTTAPAPEVAAKPAPGTRSASQSSTSIRASGATSGSSEYLARVQLKINNQWVAPPVDPSARSLSVVIKFRLHRTGSVSDVIVEQTSGNPYYDMAAKRAILGATPLPSFPESMSDRYLDTHFTFAVKELVS